MTDLASTPGSEPHALFVFLESFVTNKTLFPIFLSLPLREDFPVLVFLVCNLSTSFESFRDSMTLDISLALEIDSKSSDTIIGNDSISSTL